MNIIEDFVTATGNMASPERFRRWCAISIVSCALSRRVWTYIEDDLKLFANTYVMLVSPPGIGKTRPMDVSKKLLGPLPKVSFSPDEVTRQRTIEQIGEVFLESRPEGERSYLFWLPEIATFMTQPDPGWMQALARLWDCPDKYEKQIKGDGKGSDKDDAKRRQTTDYLFCPYVCMQIGAQPSWFAEGFPKSSYEMGLPARTFFIYADEKPHRVLFRKRKQVANMEELRAGLKKIMERVGPVPWEEEAQDAFVAWMDGGQEPVVDDPLLTGYNTRRDMHAGKLAMIVAVSRGHETITGEDLSIAFSYLFEAEVHMPKALTNAGGNVYRAHEMSLVTFLQSEYNRTGQAVTERTLKERLARTVNSAMVDRLLGGLLDRGEIKQVSVEQHKHPNRWFMPGRPEEPVRTRKPRETKEKPSGN